jgi:ribosomal peptide maturation radical SAM protein 1
MEPVRIALVAMPWSHRDRPSAAIAALSAWVKRERPGVEVVCRSAFVDVAADLGLDRYQAIAEAAYSMGELLYMAVLYPEQAAGARESFVRTSLLRASIGAGPAEDWGAHFDDALPRIEAHLEALAEELAAGFALVGLTTCFGQVFPNLALARAIKRRAPSTQIVLGGSTVSARVGPSLLSEYAFVDHVIQGEGERPLVALIDAVARGETLPDTPGVLSRATAPLHPRGAPFWETERLDDLPLPDYDEYAARAEEHAIDWQMPLEGSRGCWWDRTHRTGDPRDTCYFCNLNIQWGVYREKSAAKIARELGALSDRHRNLKVYFVDNILRHRGVVELAEAIRAEGKELEIFYEMRASVRPYDVLAMWEAGLRATQFGIEGLSTSYLARIGKGTTTMQNLSAMRLCAELGIANHANLIVDFPGSTQAEVDETRENILSYALSFDPPSVTTFHLGMDCTVDAQREAMGITRVRNPDRYRPALPDDVWSRLDLADLDFDPVAPGVDWGPVREARARWAELHGRRRGGPLLLYRDGGSFLVVEDERFGDFRSGTFDAVARDVYLFATEPRSLDQIERRLHGRASPAQVAEALGRFVEYKLMFREGDRFLALAVAPSPAAAARRIRRAHAEEEARRPRVLRLPLAG